MTGPRGWVRLGPLPGLQAWADAALPAARRHVLSGDEEWRCGGTWLAGVDALPNGAGGDIAGVPLPSELRAVLPWHPDSWHAAQLSTLRPGYPQPWAGESDAAFRFRQTRDAGKTCRRQTDCETECLARSRTCAPITPLFGCNPVLQADGREVNLCID